MCEPTAAIAGGNLLIGGIGAVADHMAQQDAHDANRRAANAAATHARRGLSLREMQEEAASRQSVFQADLEARRADAIARVQAGESGVAGASVDMVLSDIERQRAMYQTTEETNLRNIREQLAHEKDGVEAERRSRINSVAAPNPWATALRIGGHGLNAAGTYYRTTPQGAGGGSGRFGSIEEEAKFYSKLTASRKAAMENGGK